jgi:phosphatidylserine decarboxylase
LGFIGIYGCEFDFYSNFIVIFYLSPGDYHRYHSPVDFTARKRLHVAGFLKPVKISYLENHKVN